eukprot:363197-Chlamydomonas_euryale.AAC.16
MAWGGVLPVGWIVCNPGRSAARLGAGSPRWTHCMTPGAARSAPVLQVHSRCITEHRAQRDLLPCCESLLDILRDTGRSAAPVDAGNPQLRTGTSNSLGSALPASPVSGSRRVRFGSPVSGSRLRSSRALAGGRFSVVHECQVFPRLPTESESQGADRQRICQC